MVQIQYFFFWIWLSISHLKKWEYKYIVSLFRNKRFILEEMTRQIASKFSILYTYEKQKLLSYFFISYLKKKNIKKELWIFYAIKYGKLCHILPGHFIKYKTLISEQWVTAFDYVYISAGANMWLPWMVQKEIIYASLKNVLHN